MCRGGRWGERLPDWDTLPADLPVILMFNSAASTGGKVDCAMSDGSAICILDDEGHRRLIHQSDSYIVHLAVPDADATGHEVP